MPNRDQGRVVMSAGPSGLRVEIRPLVRTRGGRIRLAALTITVLGAALFGAFRLETSWETSLKRASFGDLPLPVLVALTLAVGVSTPAALVGLAALAFAEETIEVGPEAILIRTTAFEKTRTRLIPLAALECWRETYLPLSPWWTWSVSRLAARAGGRLTPLAGAAGPTEKRAIGRALALATGKPLIRDWGRNVPAGSGDGKR
ncbi:MAG TPA: hypothetical protein VLO07_05580 [Thermoanaerobaculia bacterium]|nr:hypothetical protein [Thermoanaerobaculia bacterium]